MNSAFSFLREALGLFSPESGLDHSTASKALRHQLSARTWKVGLADEFAAALRNDAFDWMGLVSNTEFCLGEFNSAEEAKAFVLHLLGPFVTLDGKPGPS